VQIGVEPFNKYFQGQQMDPAAVAKGLGVTNYPEATLGAADGTIDIPRANFFGQLDPEHQKRCCPTW